MTFSASSGRLSSSLLVIHCSSATKVKKAKHLGESRSQEVIRLISLEHLFHSMLQFSDVDAVIHEYFDRDHAEPEPVVDLCKPVC